MYETLVGVVARHVQKKKKKTLEETKILPIGYVLSKCNSRRELSLKNIYINRGRYSLR